MDKKKNRITLIGAGLVGSLLSVYLARRGYQVRMYERRPDMRKDKVTAGRSINLALSDRGFKGLEGVGLAGPIRKIGIPMYGRVIHQTNGEVVFQPYGKDKQAIYSVSRAELNKALMDFAGADPNVSIEFNKRCIDVNLQLAVAELQDELSGEKSFVESDMVIAADGAFSAVRYAMLKTDRFEYSQHYLEHGYKELSIPAGPDNTFRLEKHALHIWPRNSYMLIALPNLDGSFTCTLFFPFEGQTSFEALDTAEKVTGFFNKEFPDAAALMPELTSEFFQHPTGSLVTVKCFPWTYKDKVLMLGDASHAIVPFFGQGMNAGFEDCTVLNELMDTYEDWKTILRAFEDSRKPNTDAIAELAYENFIEMRDKVADPLFLFRKKVEKFINEKYPEQFIPKYSMVTFSDIPYSEALETGKRQDAFFDKLLAAENIRETWNTPSGEDLIDKLLREYGFIE